MTDQFRITIAQLNPTVGDLEGNAAKAKQAWLQGAAQGSDFVTLPEMFITGYNTQDLVMKPAFQYDAMDAVRALAKECADGPALGIGGPWVEDGALFNAYFILNGGDIQAIVKKHHLPNETVFDEVRIFEPGQVSGPYVIKVCASVAQYAKMHGTAMLLKRLKRRVPSFCSSPMGRPIIAVNWMCA